MLALETTTFDVEGLADSRRVCARTRAPPLATAISPNVRRAYGASHRRLATRGRAPGATADAGRQGTAAHRERGDGPASTETEDLRGTAVGAERNPRDRGGHGSLAVPEWRPGGTAGEVTARAAAQGAQRGSCGLRLRAAVLKLPQAPLLLAQRAKSMRMGKARFQTNRAHIP